MFDVSKNPKDLLVKARALAAAEHVSLPKFLAAMLRHAIRGDNLANIHFYQDGSGDTYDVEEIRRMCKQAEAESRAGLTTVCGSKGELLAHLDEIERMVSTRKNEAKCSNTKPRNGLIGSTRGSSNATKRRRSR